MDVDAKLRYVGTRGWIQNLNCFIYGMVVFPAAFQLTGVTFTMGPPEAFRCLPPPAGYPADSDEQPAVPGWGEPAGGAGRGPADGCSLYAAVGNGSSDYYDYEGDNLTTCSAWVYRTSHGETTAVTDLNLVCDRKELRGTLQSSIPLGVLVGSFPIGQLSDTFGRRAALLVCLAGVSLAGTAMSLTWNYSLLFFFGFVLGFFLPGILIVRYVRMIEMYTPSQRLYSHTFSAMPWCLGLVLVGPSAYLLPNWRHLQLVGTLPCLLLIPMVWYSYESIRWLVQKGRVDEAEGILRRIAESKGIQYPDPGQTKQAPGLAEAPTAGPDGAEAGGLDGAEAGGLDGAEAAGPDGAEAGGPDGAEAGGLDGAGTGGPDAAKPGAETKAPAEGLALLHLPAGPQPSGAGQAPAPTGWRYTALATAPRRRRYTALDLLRSRRLFFRSLVVFYCWFTSNVIYYGITLNVTNLAGDKYVNFTLFALTEIPTFIFDFFIILKVGRRRPLVVFYLLCSLGCLITAFTPTKTASGSDLTVLIIVVAMVGKFFATAAFDVTYLVTSEVFPTVLRNIGVGGASLFGRVGGILAPFVVSLTDPPVPLLVFSATSLVAGLLVLTLPETHNKPLPETIEGLERQDEA